MARLGASGRRLARPYLAKPHTTATRIAAAQALATVGDAASVDAIVALLDELESAAAAATAATDPARKRHGAVVWALASGLPRRAHREFLRRAFAGPESLRDGYADLVSTIRRRHPAVETDGR